MKYVLSLCLLFVTISCKSPWFDKDNKNTPSENFQYLWEEVDQKFALFEAKQIDWSQVYDTYKPQIKDNMSDEELFIVLRNMFLELKDGHSNLETPFDTSSFNIYEDILNGIQYPYNYDQEILVRNYFDKDIPFHYTGEGTFLDNFLKDHPNIAYVRFRAFNGKVTNDLLDILFKRYKNAKGMIFDIRKNPGGSTQDYRNIIARLLDEEKTVVYQFMKNGPKREDFTDKIPIRIKPATENGDDEDRNKREMWPSSKPFIVLTSRGSFSAASFFSLSTKVIPNATLVGDITGGGLGIPIGGELPNGWTYRFSGTKSLDANLEHPEYENGVPPDIKVLLDRTIRDKDEVLEKAIELINAD